METVKRLFLVALVVLGGGAFVGLATAHGSGSGADSSHSDGCSECDGMSGMMDGVMSGMMRGSMDGMMRGSMDGMTSGSMGETMNGTMAESHQDEHHDASTHDSCPMR